MLFTKCSIDNSNKKFHLIPKKGIAKIGHFASPFSVFNLHHFLIYGFQFALLPDLAFSQKLFLEHFINSGTLQIIQTVIRKQCHIQPINFIMSFFSHKQYPIFNPLFFIFSGVYYTILLSVCKTFRIIERFTGSYVNKKFFQLRRDSFPSAV